MSHILLVEDDETHAKNATEVLTSHGHQVTRARDLSEAWRLLPTNRFELPGITFDGVLSDVHFAHSSHQPLEVPAGIAIGVACTAYGIPFVLCTDGYHHSAKLEWVNMLINADKVNWTLVDNYDEDGTKNWSYALEVLEEKIGK